MGEEVKYLRCGHCRGFYSAELSQCRYCGKSVPLKEASGVPKVFPDRATCRAIQVAEYEQLPPEAHEDYMRPDPQLLDKLCYCLHCGKKGGLFEAVEMRWLANECMWACPCTTCGGRGFAFGIQLAECLWQCAQCEHWYTPANGDYRASNAKCPQCGSTLVNGWFDDECKKEELNGEEIEAKSQRDGDSSATGEAVTEAFGEGLPWMEDEGALGEEKIPDDIDFPRVGRDQGEGGHLNDENFPG
jgi:RNA polymerase subunit RPABC4/transcription elongation factor Spt4